MVMLKRVVGGAEEDLVLGGRVIVTLLEEPFEVSPEEELQLSEDGRFEVVA